MTNEREIDEAVLYIREGLRLLNPIDDAIAIESFEQAIEFLIGELLSESTYL